ncbi:hypothetical protein [Sinomonas humi]|uniref:Uncharacterized protein n=1 Tax=Sinomonas humi TaxID=1338436 RepID=A0A0B2AGU8_9MICC|nr:hypothetical protein [Sinomonas humi]KHL01184.1 hypothetical protein LK10_17275 [Sinomonas humi]
MILDRLEATPEFASMEKGPAVELAVGVGSLLGFVLSLGVSALYFSLASILESRLLPSLRLGFGRLTLGPLAIASIGSVLYLHLLAILLAVPTAKGEWPGFIVVALVGLCAPLLFRRQWIQGSARTKISIFALSTGVAASALLL